MDYLESRQENNKSFIRLVFSERGRLFALAYCVCAVISFLQKTVINLLWNDMGYLDSITSNDYIEPAIDSAALLLSLAAFVAAGFIAYKKDKVKMLRFPMAFCISRAFGEIILSLLWTLTDIPMISASALGETLGNVQGLLAGVLSFVAAVPLFVSFDRESEDDEDEYYYSEYYVDNPRQRKSIKDRILSHKLCVIFVVLITCFSSMLVEAAVRTGLTTVFVALTEDYYWLGGFIEVVCGAAGFGMYFILSAHFSRKIKKGFKLLGLIYFANYTVSVFGFIVRYIANAFDAVGDSLLHSVFSTVFVGITEFILAAAKLILVVIICVWLKRTKKND